MSIRVLVVLVIVAVTTCSSMAVAQPSGPPTAIPVLVDCTRLSADMASYIPRVRHEVGPPRKSKLTYVAIAAVGDKDKRVKTQIKVAADGTQTVRLKPRKDWSGLTVASWVTPPGTPCVAPIVQTTDGWFAVYVQSGQLIVRSQGQDVPGPSLPTTGGATHVAVSIADVPGGTSPASIYFDGVLAGTIDLPAGWYERRSFRTVTVGSGTGLPDPQCDPTLSELLIVGRPLSAGEAALAYQPGPVRWCQWCCRHQYIMFNDLPNTVATIEITPTDPLDVLDVYPEDEDDWTITRTGSPTVTSYSIQPADGGFFPADPNEAKNVALIDVDSARAPVTVQVVWLDGSAQPVKTEQLTLACPRDLSKYEDESSIASPKRTTLSGTNDKFLFSATVPTSCETLDFVEKSLTCEFTRTFSCPNNAANRLNLTAKNPNANFSYKFNVDIPPAAPTAYPGATAAHPLPTPGLRNATVRMTMTDPQDVDHPCVAAEDFSYCVPSGDFQAGTPIPRCNGAQILQGWDVAFTTPELCDTNGFSWDFGDFQTGGAQTGVPNAGHFYASPLPTTYDVKLIQTDTAGGCVHEKTKPVVIDPQCNANFQVEYELCGPINPEVMYDIVATFTADSAGFCRTDFDWEFAPGVTATGRVVQHTYHVLGANLNQLVSVKFTMTHPDVCAAGVSLTKTFSFKQLDVSIEMTPCGDGEMHYRSFNAPNDFTWDITGNPPLPGFCHLKARWVEDFDQEHFSCYLDNGVYTASFTAKADRGIGVKTTCSKSTQATMDKACCEDFKSTPVPYVDKSMNNKDYRMVLKSKVRAHRLLGYTHEQGKTKFKVKKSILGRSYYQGLRAGTIRAQAAGNLAAGGQVNSEWCACTTPDPYTTGDQRSNRARARFNRYDFASTVRAVSKDIHMETRHYVQHKSGWDWPLILENKPNERCEWHVIQ